MGQYYTCNKKGNNMSLFNSAVGKTIQTISETSEYLGYPFKDQGDVTARLIIIKFTDNTELVNCSIPRDNGDGSSSILESWFSSVEEALNPKWFGGESEDDFDEDEDDYDD